MSAPFNFEFLDKLLNQFEPLPHAQYWITNESICRMAEGGNSKGAVPVHGKPSVTAKNELFTAAQMHAYAAAFVLAEKKRIYSYLSDMHESSKQHHNYYAFAALELFGEYRKLSL